MVVAAGDDDVPASSCGVVGERDAVVLNGPGRDAFVVSADVERGDGGTVGREQQGGVPLGGVSGPGRVGGIEHQLTRTLVQAPVLGERIEGLGASGAQ